MQKCGSLLLTSMGTAQHAVLSVSVSVSVFVFVSVSVSAYVPLSAHVVGVVPKHPVPVLGWVGGWLDACIR